ncbi:thioredoxin domain-containing protein 8-like isoform X2 [Tamandua tetradactyla]|uniref:thioredoxin domain-containing protein 8-like isoform X2 n=1 Tax=Tamandua tetradactyla TaxID=48850 RepID=UPI0040538BD7
MFPLIRVLSLQYLNVLFANVDVDDSPELAQMHGIEVLPTFKMFKKAQKVTLLSRIKRTICCCRSGFMAQEYLADNGNKK